MSILTLAAEFFFHYNNKLQTFPYDDLTCLIPIQPTSYSAWAVIPLQVGLNFLLFLLVFLLSTFQLLRRNCNAHDISLFVPPQANCCILFSYFRLQFR